MSKAATPRRDDVNRGTSNDSKRDAEAALEDSRHESPDVAKQLARDEADMPGARGEPQKMPGWRAEHGVDKR